MTERDPRFVWAVDDDPQVLRYISEVLGGVGLSVEPYASGDDFIRRWRPAGIGCVLLDVRMPQMTGPEVHEWLRARHPAIPVIFLSGHADVSTAVRAMKFGAFDFIEKPFNAQQLIECVNAALRLPAVTRDTTPDPVAPGEARWLDALTARERQVLDALRAGQRTKLMATELGISVRTVETHRANIMEKAGVRSVVELLAMLLPR